MKFHPILFSTEMVPPIQQDRKTQTRRVLKNQSDGNMIDFGHTWELKNLVASCPYGQTGDVLWVRENWQLSGWDFEDGMMYIRYTDGEILKHVVHDPTEDCMWLLEQVEQLEKKGIIKQDPTDEERFVFTDKKQPFKPSIHMPKAACRIFLQIKNIRVERLQDISEDDAVAEGIGTTNGIPVGLTSHYIDYLQNDNCYSSSVNSFDSLWKKINGEESWNSNPWVWVIEFERIEKPENFC